MNRRGFLGGLGLVSGIGLTGGVFAESGVTDHYVWDKNTILSADLLIAGGGLGGVAAALAALRNGESVIMTEVTDWIGGQLTQQAVPPDEHPWIETHGAPVSYRNFRTAVRDYYRAHYPLTESARDKLYLNPGDGDVSKLCHEPKIALAVLEAMLAPYISAGKLTLLLEHEVTSAEVSGTLVSIARVKNLRIGKTFRVSAHYFIDATELGDLLPLTHTEFVTGTESKLETDELHAPVKGDADDVQAFTMVFAIDYRPGENHTIPKPDTYDFWEKYIPAIAPAWSGKLLSLSYSNPQTLKPRTLGFNPDGSASGSVLNLWNYRKIINRFNFKPDFFLGDITIVNWPQNDYMLGSLIGISKKEFDKHVQSAKQLSLSLLYWLQTQVPRPDGGKGWPGIRLRNDVVGTEDGFAKYPYIRESRRIKAVFTIKEQHVGKENRKIAASLQEDSDKAAYFYDSVGIGYYHIDLHPTQKVNYVDFPSLPFQIPLGALIPVRMDNLLPANKNIGTTHITNGCYRLHPVEWSIGEAVGLLVHFAKKHNLKPREVRSNKKYLVEFQRFIQEQGVEIYWK